MCVEWLKANGHPVPPQPAAPSTELASEAKAPTKPATDLFGNPNPDFRPARAEAPTPKGIATPTPVATPTSAETTPVVDVDQLRGFTAEDIDSFRALGVEVQLHSEVYGDVWLVPAYTGQDRKEITPEHAATLARVMSVFPGSYVVSFEKTAKEAKP